MDSIWRRLVTMFLFESLFRMSKSLNPHDYLPSYQIHPVVEEFSLAGISSTFEPEGRILNGKIDQIESSIPHLSRENTNAINLHSTQIDYLQMKKIGLEIPESTRKDMEYYDNRLWVEHHEQTENRSTIEDTVRKENERPIYSRRRILAACTTSILGCIDCDITGTSCTTCKTGYYLDPVNIGNCTACTVMNVNCLRCNQTDCLQCGTSFYPSGPDCKCDTPYKFLVSAVNCKTCVTYCRNCNAVSCIECDPYFNLNGTTACAPSIAGCASFVAGGAACSQCQSTWVPDPGNSSQCAKCPNGTYWVSNYTCQPCNPVRCNTCVTSATTCTSCNSGYVFVPTSSYCVKDNCPTATYFNIASDTCDSCNTTTCLDCQGGKQDQSCQICAPGYTRELNYFMARCWKSDYLCPDEKSFRIQNGYCNSPVSEWAAPVSNYQMKLIMEPNLNAMMTPTLSSYTECHPSCGTCDAANSTKCLYCADGYAWVAIEDTMLCIQMPFTQGYYNGTNKFPPAAGLNCSYETASANGTCYSCQDSFVWTPSRQCRPDCPTNQVFNYYTVRACENRDPFCSARDSFFVCIGCLERFYLEVTNTCVPCHQSCLACVGPSDVECSVCSPGFQKVGSLCQIVCKAYQYYDSTSSTCVDSIYTCSTASSGFSDCTSCTDYSLALSRTCSAPLCGMSLYWSGSSCISCPSGCLSCISSSICTECMMGFELNSGACVNISCVFGCSKCIGPGKDLCVEAASGNYISHSNYLFGYQPQCGQMLFYNNLTRSCEPCHPLCQACNGPAIYNCTWCVDGYFRFANHCTPMSFDASRPGIGFDHESQTDLVCSVYHTQCDRCNKKDGCTKCFNGFHSTQTGSCNPCSSNTKYCLQNWKGLSLACSHGYFHGNGANCTRICLSYQYANNNAQCVTCAFPCERCAGGSIYCFKCLPGDILDSTKQTCVQNSRMDLGGYWKVSSPTRCTLPCRKCDINDGTLCTECAEGFFLTAPTCTRCDPICLTCSGAASNCTSCHMGYTYDGALGTCTAVCERYEYLDTTTNQCMLCPYPCKFCNPITPSICTACPIGFRLASGACLPCPEKCPYCTATACITRCFRTFTLVGGACVKTCPTATYLNYTTLGCHSCSKFCSECVGPSHFNCTSCKPGFALSPLSSAITDNTSVVSGPCLRGCASNKYLLGPLPNECHPCHVSCSTCAGPRSDNCLTCPTSSYQVVSSCFHCHPFCSTCNGPSPFHCKTCPPGSSLSVIGYCEIGAACLAGTTRNHTINTCQNCDPTCNTCHNLTQFDCDTCKITRPLYMASNGTCQNSCPIHTYYDLPTKSCPSCHLTCSDCIGASSTECTSCFGVKRIQLDNSCQTGCVGSSFPNPNGTTHCAACHATCATCSNALSTGCLTCPGVQNLQPDFSCTLGCPTLYYPDASKVCRPCHVNCLQCSGPAISQCTGCGTGRSLRTDNVCIRVCTSAQFYKDSTDACVACDTTCLTCHSNTALDCDTCKPSRPLFMVANSSCQLGCNTHTFYNATSQACQTCHGTCGECSGPEETQCTSCFGSGEYIQLNSTCQVGCVNGTYAKNSTHCAACEGTCTTCNGPSSSQCTSCPSPRNLQPDKTCNFGCPASFIVTSNRICAHCYPNCRTCLGFNINDCETCDVDRYLRSDGTCIKYCSSSFFYQETSDSCERCHSDCATCTSGSVQSCVTCYPGHLIQPGGGCLPSCPDGYYGNSTAGKCLKCHGSCYTCYSESASSCTSCNTPMVLAKNSTCIDACPTGQYPNAARNCSSCHISCKNCLGETASECTACYEPDFSRLTDDSQCVNCITNSNPDHAVLCAFMVSLTLKTLQASTVINPTASATLAVSFEGISKFMSRLSLQVISASIVFGIDGLSTNDFKYEFAVRENQILIDLWFSVTKGSSVAFVKPSKTVILRNPGSGVSDLVFADRRASCSVDVSKAPDMELVSSLASAAQASNSVPPLVTQLSSVGMLLISMGLGAPLMRFLRVFKLISRFRLINVGFGAYLELFLSLANTVFKFGGDEISLEAIMLSPNSRGKLSKYKVTAIISEVMSMQVGFYIVMVAARIYRFKIRQYAVNESTLTVFDRVINFLAEFSRVIFMTLIGIDVFFYAMHCTVHMRWAKADMKDFSSVASVWQSLVILIILPVDIILMIIENNRTNFDYLRTLFRQKNTLMTKMKEEAKEPIEAGTPLVPKQVLDLNKVNLKLVEEDLHSTSRNIFLPLEKAFKSQESLCNTAKSLSATIEVAVKVKVSSKAKIIEKSPKETSLLRKGGSLMSEAPTRKPSIDDRMQPESTIELLQNKEQQSTAANKVAPSSNNNNKNISISTRPKKKKKKITQPIKIEKDKFSNPLTEQFFGNGIKLHKLRTSSAARFYNTAALLKLFFFEPFYVTLQMLPSIQITGLLLVQTCFTAYAAYTGLRCQAFTSVFSFVAALTTEVAMFLFLTIGFIFHMGGGASRFEDKFRNFLQFTGIAMVALAALIGAADLFVSLVRTFCNYLTNRKVSEFEQALKKQREEQGLVRHRVIGRDLPGAEPPVPPVDADMSSSVADIKANQVGQSAKPVLGKTRLAPGKRLSRPPLQPLARK